MTDAAIAQQFIDALQVLERDGDPTKIIDLFTENSEVGNIVSSREFSGQEGARAFWETYRNTFGEVASSFRNVIVSDGRAALEWTTTGTSPAGAPIAYEGVSILEMADGKITRFRAYFDPHDLGHQIEQAAQGR
ncbi:MAG: nuclear transport factor 2 family protein [Chloroflexi bacterium]|nr:nuclear transport factor 2 family protein [Chloroflexota bacterium]